MNLNKNPQNEYLFRSVVVSNVWSSSKTSSPHMAEEQRSLVEPFSLPRPLSLPSPVSLPVHLPCPSTLPAHPIFLPIHSACSSTIVAPLILPASSTHPAASTSPTHSHLSVLYRDLLYIYNIFRCFQYIWRVYPDPKYLLQRIDWETCSGKSENARNGLKTWRKYLKCAPNWA